MSPGNVHENNYMFEIVVFVSKYLLFIHSVLVFKEFNNDQVAYVICGYTFPLEKSSNR